MSVVFDTFREVGSGFVPAGSDILIGSQMIADPVFRRLSGRVAQDVINVGMATKQEIDQTVAQNAPEVPGRKNVVGRMMSKLYVPTIVVYTAADDIFTAPPYHALAEKTKHLPEAQQQLINNGALLGLSGGMALGLSLAALKWRKNRGLEPKPEADQQYSLDSMVATTAMGAPLRTHLGEIKNKLGAAVNSADYALAGQGLLYSALAAGGTTNGVFWGGLATYVSHRYTKDLYNGTYPVVEPANNWPAPQLETVARPDDQSDIDTSLAQSTYNKIA